MNHCLWWQRKNIYGNPCCVLQPLQVITSHSRVQNDWPKIGYRKWLSWLFRQNHRLPVLKSPSDPSASRHASGPRRRAEALSRRESVMSPPKWSDESVFHVSRCRKIMFDPRSFMGSRFLTPKLVDWQQIKMTPKIKSKTVSWYFHWTMWNHDNMLTTILIHINPYYSICVHFRFNHLNFGKNISNHINLKSSMHIYI